jgi:SAM-dependent methyltransferase
MSQLTTPESHWNRNAQHWQLLTSPLRPCAEDVAFYQQIIRRWRADAGNPPCRVLILGVTPELCALDWPADTELLACDHSRAMIEINWRHAEFLGKLATPICTDWRALPLPAGSCNIAIGDGSASMLALADDLPRACRELDRILEPNATLILRLFARPQIVEEIADIAADAIAGRIVSFHAFKWRLAMALQGDASTGVRLADIWDSFTAQFPDRPALARCTGWSPEAIATIDSYRGAAARYHFHRLDEIAATLQPRFTIFSVHVPTYELGECCPIIAVRRSR